MAFSKFGPSSDIPSLSTPRLKFSSKVHDKVQPATVKSTVGPPEPRHADIDLREIYFLIMHFLSAGPCRRTSGQLWNELLEHQLLPRRYHAWYSRSGAHSGDEKDNGMSFPLSYSQLVERYPHIEKDHLVELLRQLILSRASPLHELVGGSTPNAADVPTLLGSGSFSLLESDRIKEDKSVNRLPGYLRWPHMQVDQVRGLSLREIGGGFTKHHRSPSIRAACYAVAKPSTMVQKMQNVKKLRGHRNAVYCAIFDRSGRYVITGSDDRLVKIWSMETAFCLSSCRGHEGDITDLAVSSNNVLVASASNDFIIRVWRLPDGAPVSVLRGHTGAVTAIAFSPRPSCVHHILSSSDDGTCRIWDSRHSQSSLRVYVPKPTDPLVGKGNGPSSSSGVSSHQILCCAYNANGLVFVTGSSDTHARVWNACKAKTSTDDSGQPEHEMDKLSGHENDVNYVQFSGCAAASRSSIIDNSKEDNLPKFKNSWFTHDNIVTCSRDGSAIIWIPKSRKSHAKVGRWTQAYHLKVPPPPMPPQTSRGGPRQRILPTPRGVNMIVWSLDNRFVLAAIMDCRICVWNAGDGSLVHSLTGHSQSTYVLDVHPFNPRIAMSAGYDGLTIVWDIWEGTPIRKYETGRFKLVDGKFSPDGTSIVLSDDVGQIYILSTGQGESQKDAKYDQFFLGDYRPLIRDIHGNVLDQETQLVPYRRNIQDLLCDSSMIPYAEPYQSMYQKRRSGALGIEWRPSSVNLAVGPVYDLQDYQMLPLPDLDRLMEPIPEFLDAMDWEPENEIQSDDNDSEYNVTEEYYSEGDHGSLSNGFRDDPEFSEDSDTGGSNRDSFHRSKRRKHKAVVEFMTSSGRRVKRRNLDEPDNTLSQCNTNRRSRNRKKAKTKKSSSPKFLRPQRVAARNALNKFSQLSGGSSDEYEDEDEEDDVSGSDTSENESIVPELTTQSESDRSLQNVLRTEKEESLGEFEDVVNPLQLLDSQTDGGKKKLILRLSTRNSKKPEIPKEASSNLSRHMNPTLSFKAPDMNNLCSRDIDLSSVDVADFMLPPNYGGIKIREKEESENPENRLDLSAGIREDKIRWGDVKARTSKRLRSGDPIVDTCPGSAATLDEQCSITGNLKAERGNKMTSSLSEREKHGGKSSSNTCLVEEQLRPGSSEGLDGAADEELAPSKCSPNSGVLEKLPEDDNQLEKGKSSDTCRGSLKTGHKDELANCNDYDESLTSLNGKTIDKASSVLSCKTGAGYFGNLEDKAPTVQRIKIKLGSSGAGTANKFSLPIVGDSKDKMCKVVYTRSKSCRVRTDSEADIGDTEESTSNAGNQNHNSRMEFSEPPSDRNHRTRSTGTRRTTWDPMANNGFKARDDHASVETSRRAESFVLSAREPLVHKEWKSNEGLIVGLRSSRNRRANYCGSDAYSLDTRKSRNSRRKLSWLMVSDHEDSYRYIPQLGDNVVYVRQGHHQYLVEVERRHVSEASDLWGSLKGIVRAVEFCVVEKLAYFPHPGSGESYCKITLKFVDPSSNVFEENFELNLPELENFADFIVERTLFDASIGRNWRTRDKCEVWWKNGDGVGGNWWDGRIISEKPKSLEYPDSPWERFTIKYKNDGSDFLHSPWELRDTRSPWQPPCIDDESRGMLLSFFTKLEESGKNSQDRYGIQKLKQVSSRSDFLNRFPVPMSFDVVYSRLENNYYRRLEAVEHDFELMLTNASAYFGRIGDIDRKMNRLEESFKVMMSTF